MKKRASKSEFAVIGRPTPRIDGPLKVSGAAHYAADFHFPETLHAVPVEATIAHGRLTKLNTAAAAKMPAKGWRA